MRWLLILLVAGALLSVLQAAIAGLVLVVVLLIVWGALFRPAQAFGLLLFFLCANVLMNHTVAGLVFLAFVWLVTCLQRPDELYK